MRPKRVLVCGAGGFIGGHLVKRLCSEGHWVRGVDLYEHAYSPGVAHEFMCGDLRKAQTAAEAVSGMDEVYQLAADMGGAGYIFTGAHDADVMHNSALCNLQVLGAAQQAGVSRIFYASSACIYPVHNQQRAESPVCAEASAYPAAPDSAYGWEKLFSERLYLSFQRIHGIQVRIARYHNIYGPEGAWQGGKEKAPAAICRKIAAASTGESIDIWGDGKQTRSFLYVDACIEATLRLMASDFSGPVNIGSEERVSINELTARVMKIAGKSLPIKHIKGPLGVRGRNSDNTLIRKQLNWEPVYPLDEGLKKTYAWIAQQVSDEIKQPQKERITN